MKTNELEKYNPNKIQANAPASWGQVKYWANTAAKGAMVSAAAMVMAGFNLLDLRKKQGIKQGKRTDLAGNLPHDVGSSAAPQPALSWPEMVTKYAGVSDETARRWMATAEGVKSKWKKNPPQERIRELMRMPVSDWNETDTELVFKSLAKAIDGATMVEFMRELGIAKLKTGNPDADGDGRRKLGAAEEQQKQLELALEDSALAGRTTLRSLKTVVLLTRENDLEAQAQLSVHEFAVKALHKLLNTPRQKRDDAWLAEYMAMIEKESPLKVS